MRIYFVYILFDWLGIPRYVGKGGGDPNRDLWHSRYDSSNLMKNEFIERTWIMLEEIPSIRIRENLTEIEAFETEIVLIKAIGRSDQGKGPLTNMTDGGEGASGYKYSDLAKAIMSEKSIQRNARPDHKLILQERAKRQHREGRFGKATWKEDTVRILTDAGRENQKLNAKQLNEQGKLGPRSWKKPHPHPPTVLGGRRINNGQIHKILQPAIPLPEGFEFGSLPKVGRKISSSKKGKSNGLFGKKFPNRKKPTKSDPSGKKLSTKGSIMTPDQREKLSLAHGGKPWSEEKKAAEWVYFYRRLGYNLTNGLPVPPGY
jgi:hypothetical protein